MNHPTFRIAPMSISGYSLLQWDEPGQRFPHSIQVPTATAQFIVESVKRAERANEMSVALVSVEQDLELIRVRCEASIERNQALPETGGNLGTLRRVLQIVEAGLASIRAVFRERS